MRVPSSSSTAHNFARVPAADIPRSSFDRSCTVKTTFDAGWLVPVFVDEVLPGDTFNCHMTAFARLATPIKPFMDNLYLDTFFFFVPIRLIWDNWQKFNGEQRNPNDSTSFIVPTMTSPTSPVGYIPPANWSTPSSAELASALCDYFTIPTRVPGLQHISLFHRAYNLIWNEWFRDQNLQNSVPNPTGDGPDVYTDFTLLRRGKRHDYFTSALPWPQKGPAVSIPLGTTAPVKYQFIAGTNTADQKFAISTMNSTPLAVNQYGNTYGVSSGTNPASSSYNLFTDLTTAAAATINQLRQSFQIQRLYERDARGGTRYTEIIRSHFGVVSPDARLQRPEYLGGGSTMVNVNPIAQTSALTGQPTPQGNLSAMGTVAVHNNGFVKSFTEHGVIVGMVSARADLSYQQGLNRMFSRSTRFDFYWPALSHIGEQTILNKEIYSQGSVAPTVDAAAFGYQERYAEYRYKPSAITGRFRSNDPVTLDSWHLAQRFTSLPTLSDTFIQDNPPVDRVIAVTTEPDFLMDALFKLKCARPMPMYSVPGLIDHF